MHDELKKNNLIINISFDLAVQTIKFCEQLDERRKWALSNQIMRAALSVGANTREAQNAESKSDFIHKMKIAAKEADELEYYFEVCIAAGYTGCKDLLLKTQSACKVLNKIIGTSKKRQ